MNTLTYLPTFFADPKAVLSSTAVIDGIGLVANLKQQKQQQHKLTCLCRQDFEHQTNKNNLITFIIVDLQFNEYYSRGRDLV